TEDPTGGFDESGWVFRMDDDGINDTLGTLFGAPYDLLLGRRTYDIFAAYWPYVEGENAFMGESLTQAGKYVLTSSDAPLEWEDSHRLSAIDEVPALKQSDGPDLLIQGSSTLYPQLLDAGLLDRLVLMTFPIVLGRGKRLLDGAMSAGRLKLDDHRVTGKGTVITTYEPD
ncbi:MAG TPA: riboflavin biosynthesis protein RibD, partial [Erythrobacter sp.]|nr:riboflavin biosynthesis protein RibD [Erythrobacter sp.]